MVGGEETCPTAFWRLSNRRSALLPGEIRGKQLTWKAPIELLFDEGNPRQILSVSPCSASLRSSSSFMTAKTSSSVIGSSRETKSATSSLRISLAGIRAPPDVGKGQKARDCSNGMSAVLVRGRTSQKGRLSDPQWSERGKIVWEEMTWLSRSRGWPPSAMANPISSHQASAVSRTSSRRK